mgnify:FL=1
MASNNKTCSQTLLSTFFRGVTVAQELLVLLVRVRVLAEERNVCFLAGIFFCVPPDFFGFLKFLGEEGEKHALLRVVEGSRSAFLDFFV